MDEYDNGKFRLERVKELKYFCINYVTCTAYKEHLESFSKSSIGHNRDFELVAILITLTYRFEIPASLESCQHLLRIWLTGANLMLKRGPGIRVE